MRPPLEYVMAACSPNFVADINHEKRIQRVATMYGYLVPLLRKFQYKSLLN